MEKSILKSTKKILGIDPSNTSFDQDVLTYINAAFSTLTQMGVGPTVFQVEDDTTEWDAYSDDDIILNLVKVYVKLKTQALFDPPSTSYTQAAMKDQLEQFEWRINTYREGLSWADPEAT